MKRVLKLILSAFAGLVLCFSVTGIPVHADGQVKMWRLYNPNSGEHFYTADTNERDHLYNAGWNIEGVGWVAPSEGDEVYRLYNPVAGDHHYTTNVKERDTLETLGWRYEGVGWYSGGSVQMLRQYNPNKFSCNHNYTTDTHEKEVLVSLGWNDEGNAWMAVASGSKEGARTHEQAAPAAPTNNTSNTSNAGTYAGPFVYTRYGKKYHRPDCPTVQNRIAGEFSSREEAESKGYTPCNVCNP